MVLAAEEEQKIFTQWLTIGRENNEQTSQIANFYSHWCNDDLEFAQDGNTAIGAGVVFSKDQGEGGEE